MFSCTFAPAIRANAKESVAGQGIEAVTPQLLVDRVDVPSSQLPTARQADAHRTKGRIRIAMLYKMQCRASPVSWMRTRLL
jgi:hypothetical protein